jgi:hypothetical protein
MPKNPVDFIRNGYPDGSTISSNLQAAWRLFLIEAKQLFFIDDF